MLLYLGPMIFIAIRVVLPKPRHTPFIVFFCLTIPMSLLAYSERGKFGWLFSFLELPIIWAFGLYAAVSIFKHLVSKIDT